MTDPRSRFQAPQAPTSRGSLARALAALGLAGLAGCSGLGRQETPPSAGELIALGRYEEARELAERELKAAPDDEEARAQARFVETAWHLELGRRALRAGESREARLQFELAGELAPESEVPGDWLAKLHHKLADEGLQRAIALHRRDELDLAVEEYEFVLAHRPGDEYAREGLRRARLQIDHRDGQGEDYYRKGVRDLVEYKLYEARAKIGYAEKYLGEEPKVEQRDDQVRGLLADQRMALGTSFEAEGQYAAARNEYRMALFYAPWHLEAKASLERCRGEAEASELLKQSQMMVLKGRFDDALELVERAEGRSSLLADALQGQRDAIEEGRVRARYEYARDLEADFRFPEAIAAYDEFLAEVGFYEDALARRDTLQSYVEKAEELYARASAEADPEERLLLFGEIGVFWPEYSDVQAQILALERALAGGTPSE